jgi:hypothetical protein
MYAYMKCTLKFHLNKFILNMIVSFLINVFASVLDETWNLTQAWWLTPVIPARNRKLKIQASCGINARPYSKTT